MNQENQGNNFDVPENILMKRKRGRPRKEKGRNPGENRRKHKEIASVPPGFKVVNGNQPINGGTNDVVLGQAVAGFIEAIFDAGYLIAVTVDGSDVPLRGVVFKPGCYVPISVENDVAPEAPMIRRRHISHPTENYNSANGNNLSTNETANWVPKDAKLSSSKRKKRVPTMEGQSSRPEASRGIMVPVPLKSVDLSNLIPMANEVPPVATTQAAAQIAAAKGRQVPVATLQSANQLLPFQPQTSHQLMIQGAQKDNDAFSQPSPGVSRRVEAKTLRLSGSPPKTLLDEPNRTNVTSQPSGVENDGFTTKMSKGTHVLDPGLPKMDSQFGPVHPFQTIQPDIHNEYASVDEFMGNNGSTDNMEELFQEDSVDNAEEYH